MRRVRDLLEVRVAAVLGGRAGDLVAQAGEEGRRVGGWRLEDRGGLAAGQRDAERERGRGERDGASTSAPAATRPAPAVARDGRATGACSAAPQRGVCGHRWRNSSSIRAASAAVGAVSRAGSAWASSSIIVPPRRSMDASAGPLSSCSAVCRRRRARCRRTAAAPRRQPSAAAASASVSPSQRDEQDELAIVVGQRGERAGEVGAQADGLRQVGRGRRGVGGGALGQRVAAIAGAAVVGEHLAGHAVQPRQRLARHVLARAARPRGTPR